MSQLQEIEVSDFTGGLNTHNTQFNLATNESPDMLNVEIDGRRGFYTRRGWGRWNAADIVDASLVTWDPRNTFSHHLASGSYLIYLANDGDLYSAASSNGVFSDVSVVVGASPHLADFTSWGDVCYIACGNARIPYKRDGTSAAAALADASLGYNNDYTTPAGGDGVVADLFETHSGYLFAASIREGGTNTAGAISAGTLHRNRIRWSHPNEPEDWAEADYIDINTGGGRITALMSFHDHLLIFKTDSIWALYGYNSESWQLVQVSRSVGVLSPEAVARSESAVFFYSASEQGAVYAYSGEAPVEIGEKVRRTTDEITAPEDAWLGWVGKRLWCVLPWNPTGDFTAGDTTALVFDPRVGQGSWTAHAPALGNLRSIIEGSDLAENLPLAVVGGDHACLVRLGSREAASDAINVDTTVAAFDAYYLTPWFNAGTQELRKSWRRPRVIVTQENEAVSIVMNTYKDYNEASASRSHTITISPQAATFWRLTGALETNGFDWGDGSLWGSASAAGSTITRPQPAAPGRGGLGIARAIQLRFHSDATTMGKVWGINALSLKYRGRRFTT